MNFRLKGKVEVVFVGDDMKYEKIGDEVGEVGTALFPKEPEAGVGKS